MADPKELYKEVKAEYKEHGAQASNRVYGGVLRVSQTRTGLVNQTR